MPRRPLYRETVQYSFRTLVMAIATVPVLVYAGLWLARLPLAGVGSLAIGVCVAIAAFRMLDPEGNRTLFLQAIVSTLVGVYAFWIPGGFLYYVAGVGVGAIVTWQGAAILPCLFACYGICRVKVYEKPRWQPARRDVPWPMGQYDSTVV